jgi:hypothetical protein
VEAVGNAVLVDQVRKLILEEESFTKFEDENEGSSAFKELLLVKRKDFGNSPLKAE